MREEKIAEYVERFGRAYEAVKAVCTRNLPGENPAQEPNDETAPGIKPGIIRKGTR